MAADLINEGLVDEKVEPEDVIEFGANLSGLTSKKFINLLSVIER